MSGIVLNPTTRIHWFRRNRLPSSENTTRETLVNAVSFILSWRGLIILLMHLSLNLTVERQVQEDRLNLVLKQATQSI
jgi:hypothetical protein